MAKKTVNDDLAEVITAGLNKEFKAPVAYIPGKEETPTDLTDFAPTGCTLLDLAISNRPYGGIAFGRITELTGLEGSGKSLLAAHMMANVQKMGGVAVLIDTEVAVNWDFFDAVGLDRNKLSYTHLDTVEDIFAAVESIIEMVRSSDKKRPVIIVIDSIAAASTKVELEADYEQRGFATQKAILMSQALRKITSIIGKQKIALVITNQLRQKMNAMPFSDPWTTSGGKALAFHSSVRIRLNMTGKIKNKDKQVIGVSIEANVTKNRLGPPLRKAKFDIFFDRGIDDYSSWLKFLREKDIVTGKANALTYVDESGNSHSFTEQSWPKFLTENDSLKEELYLKLCNVCIMAYNSGGLSEEDMTVESASEE
jgi:recombination protein RecA